MKLLSVLGAGLLIAGSQAIAGSLPAVSPETLSNPAYYQVGNVEIYDVPSALLGGPTEIPKDAASQLCSNYAVAGYEAESVDIGDLINIGKEVWEILKAGKASVNIETDVATAIPAGLHCWRDLENFSAPQVQTKVVVINNILRSPVVTFTYKVLWLPGGSFKGQGKYIGYATVVPADVQVSWGWKLNAKVTVPTIFNMGSKASPVAGMNLIMSYRADSAISTVEQAQTFYVDGVGQYREMANPPVIH